MLNNFISESDYKFDQLNEECGVFGIYNHNDAAAHCALGLHALQHRGQEACGIVCFDQKQFYSHTALGLVGDNFNKPDIMAKLPGNCAIGHVRYSTTGGNALKNIQPIFVQLNFGGLAVAHNGNLTNTQALKEQLIKQGCIFHSTMDTEVIVHLIAISKKSTTIDRMIDAFKQIEGAYSLVLLTDDFMAAIRDPYGVRPLIIGKLDNSYIFASESCAFDIIGAKYVRDVKPGELVIIKGEQLESIYPFDGKFNRFCIFEYIYFSRPDSLVEGRHVYEVRKKIGAQLAAESHVDADLVVPVPDSGVPAALGYAQASGVMFDLGIIRNHYVGRTFIEPTDHVRHLGVKLKHNANTPTIDGKRVILVDDSIVRGTTSKKIVNMVREAGAKEVHMRIASPPTSYSCFYGVDTPERSKLLAANYSVKEMASLIGADTLEFISIDGLYRALGEASRNNNLPQYCDACFTGDYPIKISDDQGKCGC